jgi:hypothetical protein
VQPHLNVLGDVRVGKDRERQKSKQVVGVIEKERERWAAGPMRPAAKPNSANPSRPPPRRPQVLSGPRQNVQDTQPKSPQKQRPSLGSC